MFSTFSPSLRRGCAAALVRSHASPTSPSRPQQVLSSSPAPSSPSLSHTAALRTSLRLHGTAQSLFHLTPLAYSPFTRTRGTLSHKKQQQHPPQHSAAVNMSTDECQGFEEAMRVCNELGFDVYVHPHENLEDVEKVVKEMNDSGHPCVDTKTMFLKSKKGELVMVVALLSTKTDMKRIQKESGTKDLRFAAADVLMENLHVVQGCVTPFCLVNNVEKKNIALILDKNLVESTVPLSMRPCRNDRTAAIPFTELKAFIDKLGYTYKEVDFEAEPPADELATASPTTKKGGGAPKEKKQKGAAKPEKKEGDDAAVASE